VLLDLDPRATTAIHLPFHAVCSCSLYSVVKERKTKHSEDVYALSLTGSTLNAGFWQKLAESLSPFTDSASGLSQATWVRYREETIYGAEQMKSSTRRRFLKLIFVRSTCLVLGMK